ncbi:MAG: nuclear transport factor 2 family protein [Gammaproteobacteria bacterium]
MIRSCCIGILCVSVLVGCSSPGRQAAWSEQLMDQDRAFSRMSVAEGAAAAFRGYLSADAISLPERGDAVVGVDAIAEGLQPIADYTLDWTPVAAEASMDGTLGYTWGHYRLYRRDNPDEVRVGKYLTVWRRAADGQWKAVADIGNHEPVAPD